VTDEDFACVRLHPGDGRRQLRRLIERAPAHHHGKIRRLLSFSRKYPNLDVVDPYYGGPRDSRKTSTWIEDAVQGLIREIHRRHQVKNAFTQLIACCGLQQKQGR